MPTIISLRSRRAMACGIAAMGLAAAVTACGAGSLTAGGRAGQGHARPGFAQLAGQAAPSAAGGGCTTYATSIQQQAFNVGVCIDGRNSVEHGVPDIYVNDGPLGPVEPWGCYITIAVVDSAGNQLSSKDVPCFKGHYLGQTAVSESPVTVHATATVHEQGAPPPVGPPANGTYPIGASPDLDIPGLQRCSIGSFGPSSDASTITFTGGQTVDVRFVDTGVAPIEINVRDTAPGGVSQSSLLFPGVPWDYKDGRFGTEPMSYTLEATAPAFDLGAGDIGWVALSDVC